MSDIVVGDGDTLRIMTPANQSCTLPVSVVTVQGGYGIQYATKFRPPIQNIDKAWYEATRRYGPYNHHPQHCEDWNLETGGNTDLGEPLVAPFSGVVLAALDYGGRIGRVIQILGIAQDEMIVWAGWHLRASYVDAGDVVNIGEPIGTIGNAGGVYSAHLHEQISVNSQYGIPQAWLFPANANWGWVQPSEFYKSHDVDPDLIDRLTAYDGA